MTIRIIRRTILPLLAGLALPACAALRPGALTDGARDVAYGPHPRQRMDIYVPASGGSAPKPVVFFIYGGSWANGAKETYSFVGDALSARGFVTVIADYRLVPEVRFPVFIEDGAQALRFVRDNIDRFGGAPEAIHLMGHSAGAYNAMMLTLDRRYLAAVGMRAGDIRSIVGLSGPYDFLPFDIDVTKEAFGNARDPAQTQPVNFARRDAPPVFLATGSEDTTVLPRNSERLALALRKAGARSVSLKIYQGLGHAGTATALSRLLQWQAPVLEDVVAFLQAARVGQLPGSAPAAVSLRVPALERREADVPDVGNGPPADNRSAAQSDEARNPLRSTNAASASENQMRLQLPQIQSSLRSAARQ